MTKTTIHPYLDLLTISDEMDEVTASPGPLVDALPTPPSRPGRPDCSRRRSFVTMAAMGVAAVAGFAAGWGFRALPAPHSPAEPVAARAVTTAEPGRSPWACN